MKVAVLAQLQGVDSRGVEGVQGLRNDPISPAGTAYQGIGFQSLAQLLIALAIVVILIRWLVPKYAAKYGKKSVATGLNVDIQEIGTVALGVSQAHLVQVRGRTLLLGSSAQGLTLLADLTEDDGTFLLPSPVANEPSQADFESLLERLKKLGA